MYSDNFEMIASAVKKATEAYNKEIERDGTDPSFCPISITVHMLTISFEEIGQIIYKEMDYNSEGETEMKNEATKREASRH